MEKYSMPFWKLLLLHGYYNGTLPARRRWHRRAAANSRVPIVVLFYHRIADDRKNPWTASTRSFRRQIDWLSDRFDLISLEETQRRLAMGNDRPAVSITFDDGYADNCRVAIPLLLERRIPFTYFVTLENVRDGKPFQHDQDFGDPPAPNSIAELRAMADGGAEIGAHGYTHADMGKIASETDLYREVVTPRAELEELIGHPVRYLAIPYGRRENLNLLAFEMARDAGYWGVCSAYGGYNDPFDDAFHIQRIPTDEELIRLKNRATIDPRRRRVARFDYTSAELEPGP
jgi:peptidoglycan/xylan/chitin deacetylase (PgdA/CDA1 family)